MHRSAILVVVLLAGCAQKLPSRALKTFESYEAWCAQLHGTVCKGDWPDAKPGTTALGPYRFVIIEAGAVDNFGGGRSVSFELKTKHGFVYEPVGAIGATGRAGETALNVEGLTEHGGMLDVRTHSRSVSPAGISDAQEAILFVDGAATVGVVRVHLGTNTRDEKGSAKGGFGELVWQGNDVVSKKTGLKDGEYRLGAP